MLITTETCLPEVRERLGMVFYSSVVTTGAFKDFLVSFKDKFSGKWSGYTKEIEKVANFCLEQIIEQAKTYGANAIVGVNIDVKPIFTEKIKMFLVTVYGTACII